MLKFGFYRSDITPKRPVALLGHPKSLKSTGRYTELFSKALYLSSGSTGEILIISNDLCILPTGVMRGIRESISKVTGIDKENIIVHTTHTHAGPSVAEVFGKEDSENVEQKKIINSIIKTGIEAFKNQAVGSIGIGKIDLKGISFNRRYIMKDGAVETHPYKDDPGVLKPEGPIDPGVGVIVIYDNGNNIRGIAVNYACHLTSSKRNNTKFSADFPYYAEKKLQSYFNNDNFIMLYLNGACGNVCQVNVEDKNSFEIGEKHSRYIGEKFAVSIIGLLPEVKKINLGSKIKRVYKEIKIPIRKISDKMLKEAKKISEKYKDQNFDVPELSNYGTESFKDKKTLSLREFMETDYWKKISADELINLYDRYRDNNLVDVPLTVLRISGLIIITVPGELFVEYALELKSFLKEKYELILIIELANGYVGYIPTKRAFNPKNGGYEVQFLSTSKLAKNAGDLIVGSILDMEKELHDKEIINL